jgi:hypothetical protein
MGYPSVAIMHLGTTKVMRREAARDVIIAYLISHDFEMISYERIRQNLNASYSDSFLESLVVSFPTTLRKARLKGGKIGIARILESSIDDEG